jgi:hypothetical protein
VTEPGGNPVSLAGIRFDDSNRQGNVIELTFTNTIDEDRNATAFRLVFYQGTDMIDGTIEGETVTGMTETYSFTVGGTSNDLDPAFFLPAGQSRTFVLDFDSNPSAGDWFVFTIQYDTGQTAQYFTAV